MILGSIFLVLLIIIILAFGVIMVNISEDDSRADKIFKNPFKR
jgi:hypothetical protein